MGDARQDQGHRDGTGTPDRSFSGTITRSTLALDPSTRSLLVEIDLPNPDPLLAAGNIRRNGDRLTRDPSMRWSCRRKPSTAAAKATPLFIVEQGKAKAVPVHTGITDGKWIEITSGLRGDEEVVVVGKRQLLEGSPCRASPRSTCPKQNPLNRNSSGVHPESRKQRRRQVHADRQQPRSCLLCGRTIMPGILRRIPLIVVADGAADPFRHRTQPQRRASRTAAARKFFGSAASHRTGARESSAPARGRRQLKAASAQKRTGPFHLLSTRGCKLRHGGRRRSTESPLSCWRIPGSTKSESICRRRVGQPADF